MTRQASSPRSTPERRHAREQPVARYAAHARSIPPSPPHLGCTSRPSSAERSDASSSFSRVKHRRTLVAHLLAARSASTSAHRAPAPRSPRRARAIRPTRWCAADEQSARPRWLAARARAASGIVVLERHHHVDPARAQRSARVARHRQRHTLLVGARHEARATGRPACPAAITRGTARPSPHGCTKTKTTSPLQEPHVSVYVGYGDILARK